MPEVSQSLFSNVVWHALQTKHRHFALSAGDAVRYPADVAPFAAVAELSARALQQLHSLMQPGESVWIRCENNPRIPELDFIETLPCLQMVLPERNTPRVRR